MTTYRESFSSKITKMIITAQFTTLTALLPKSASTVTITGSNITLKESETIS
jgi:hypothetical protein